jgi:hypothetical protein
MDIKVILEIFDILINNNHVNETTYKNIRLGRHLGCSLSSSEIIMRDF